MHHTPLKVSASPQQVYDMHKYQRKQLANVHRKPLQIMKERYDQINIMSTNLNLLHILIWWLEIISVQYERKLGIIVDSGCWLVFAIYLTLLISYQRISICNRFVLITFTWSYLSSVIPNISGARSLVVSVGIYAYHKLAVGTLTLWGVCGASIGIWYQQ